MQPIKIAILAMGGEGGGVLADWIVDMGKANGYVAQTTSVPGVAQRTGATIYYVELYSQAQARSDNARPVLALMPLPGDVDVVLASELMEAGRAVQRGLVTRDRTTLIASTHRVFSMTEKSALGDGRVDSRELLAHAGQAALRFIRFDMEQAARDSGSVISAVLFGALAGAGVLPFTRAQFEATIERGGIGIKPSLKAFSGAFERASGAKVAPQVASPTVPQVQARHPGVQALVNRVQSEFPSATQPFLLEGVRRLIDYQDLDYAALYLQRMRVLSDSTAGQGEELLRETARHLALWMSYEDTARVAALKTRSTRFERVRGEAIVQEGQVLAINEYMHPRLQEICETLPASLGRWLMNSQLPRRLVEHLTRHGRVIQTSSLRGYLLLRCVAAMKRVRRSTLRYAEENRRIEAWLERITTTAEHNPALAVGLTFCQRLVKGYGDTHARGVRNYDTVMDAFQRSVSPMSPATLRELCDAALADETGGKLRDAIARHALG
jgi:indolepyruvate ferredoxin oxidoreductase, beta subunit